MKTLLSRIVLLVITLLASPAQANDADTIKLKNRGLVKMLYTLPHRQDPTQFSTWVTLKGTSERAACPATVISEFDLHSIEVIKLAMMLNKPITLTFATAKDHTSLTHCEIYSVELKP